MNTGQFRKGQPPWNAGTHLSGMLGKHHSEKAKTKIGEANKKVNPKSSLNALIRRSAQFKEWRFKVFERDDYTCQVCGSSKRTDKGIRLHPHHIQSFADYPELRLAAENGQTLCEACHGRVHNIDFNGYHRKITCAVCGKEFSPKNGKYAQKTCSRECGYKYRTSQGSSKKGRHYPHLQRARLAKCLECGRGFRAVKDTARRHQKYCSHECYLQARWNYTGNTAERIHLP